MIKPPRARHCKFCDNCCQELDHHCHWIGNCIGINNKKYFFQYGLYVFLIDAMLLPRLIKLVFGTWKTFDLFENWDIMITIIITSLTLNASIFMCLVNFCLHVFEGSTLIEAKFIYKKGSKNPYNFGPWINAEHTFGGKIGPHWFLPLPNTSDPANNSISFKRMQDMGFRKYEINRDLDKIGLTFYPINWQFCDYARKKIRTLV